MENHGVYNDSEEPIGQPKWLIVCDEGNADDLNARPTVCIIPDTFCVDKEQKLVPKEIVTYYWPLGKLL